MDDEVLLEISKDDLFNEVKKLFYSKNFGLKTKSDIELAMFKIYFEAAKNLADENENMLSDYKIGRGLGISPAKVRNLKLKLDLQSEQDFDWKEEMKKVLAKQQNVDVNDNYMMITIRSRSLFYAVEDWVEDNGHTLDITLNPKQLKIPKADFYELLKQIEAISDEKNELLMKQLRIKYKILEEGKNVIEFVSLLLGQGKQIEDIEKCLSSVKVLTKDATEILKIVFSKIAICTKKKGDKKE